VRLPNESASDETGEIKWSPGNEPQHPDSAARTCRRKQWSSFRQRQAASARFFFPQTIRAWRSRLAKAAPNIRYREEGLIQRSLRGTVRRLSFRVTHGSRGRRASSGLTAIRHVSGRGGIGDGKSRDRAVSSQGRRVRSTFKLPPALRLGHDGTRAINRRERASLVEITRRRDIARDTCKWQQNWLARAEEISASPPRKNPDRDLTLRAPNKSRRPYRRGDSALRSSCRRTTAFLAEHRLSNERRKEETEAEMSGRDCSISGACPAVFAIVLINSRRLRNDCAAYAAPLSLSLSVSLDGCRDRKCRNGRRELLKTHGVLYGVAVRSLPGRRSSRRTA